LAPDTSPLQFARALSGSEVNLVHRRGKHILFDLDNGRTLITHLRMSGRFMLISSSAELPKFTHAYFELDGGERLAFQDQRHFGFMRIALTTALTNVPELRKLAPEPFSEEFSPDYLHLKLKSSRRILKEFLLDQSRVSGLGNIYAAEAMFLAGIHPAKRTHTVSRPRAEKLHASILAILNEAIEKGSTLNIDPANSDSAYNGGEYERYWRVYGRESMPCINCGETIRRIRQAARSTYFCPVCQRR
jgi:formamidopyrimidine-DNA glycosylase